MPASLTPLCDPKTMKSNVAIAALSIRSSEKTAVFNQHGGDMLLMTAVGHLIPVKGRAGVDAPTILPNIFYDIK